MSTADAQRGVAEWTERLGVAERRDDEIQNSASATSSVYNWPRRSCTARRSWSSTSRSPASTRSPST